MTLTHFSRKSTGPCFDDLVLIRSSYFAKLLQARGEAYSRPYFGAGSLRHPDETPGDQLHRWANHCQSQPLRQELRKNRWRQNGENWLSLLTVCFLDSWPQTKSSVTFDTCFWHCFYALSRGALGFALNGSSFNHFLIGGKISTGNQILWNKPLLKPPSQNPAYHVREHKKGVQETGVKSGHAFCLGPYIEKTNSVLHHFI